MGALARLLLKPEVKGVWYNAKDVTLDGFKFTECRFDNCRLFLNSTEFELNRCFIGENTRVIYSPSVARPIKMFTAPLKFLDQFYPTLVPIRHPDGTISIGG